MPAPVPTAPVTLGLALALGVRLGRTIVDNVEGRVETPVPDGPAPATPDGRPVPATPVPVGLGLPEQGFLVEVALTGRAGALMEVGENRPVPVLRGMVVGAEVGLKVGSVDDAEDELAGTVGTTTDDEEALAGGEVPFPLPLLLMTMSIQLS